MNAYVAFGSYFATGEGVTVWIAVGNTKELAEAIWRKNVDEFWHRSMDEAVPIAEMDERLKQWLPEAVAKYVDGPMPCAIEHFQRFHYNCS